MDITKFIFGLVKEDCQLLQGFMLNSEEQK